MALERNPAVEYKYSTISRNERSKKNKESYSEPNE